MSLNEDLRRAVTNELGSVDLYSLPFYSKEKRGMIEFLYKNNFIDDRTIEDALEPAVIARARKDYDVLVRNNGYADHVGRPEFLAYALSKREFSWLELIKINFDHGENPEIFVERYGSKNLLSKLREELLNPRPLPKFESGVSLDCDSCGCLESH